MQILSDFDFQVSILAPQILPALKKAFKFATKDESSCNSQVILTADTRLRVFATDLATVYVEYLPAQVYQPGKVLIPKNLLDILSTVEEATLTAYPNKLVITSETNTWNIALRDISKYQMVSLATESAHRISAAELNEVLKFTSFAISKDYSQPSLTVLCSSAGSVTACDVTQLQRIDCQLPDFNIPGDKISLLKNAFTHGTYSVSINDKFAFFLHDSGQVIGIARSYQKFPDVDRYILRSAMENKLSWKFESQAAQQALQRALVLADDPYLELELWSKGTLIKSASYAGSSEISFESSWDHKSLSVKVDAEKFLKILSCWEKVEVFLCEKVTKKAPLLIQADGRVSFLQQTL